MKQEMDETTQVNKGKDKKTTANDKTEPKIRVKECMKQNKQQR